METMCLMSSYNNDNNNIHNQHRDNPNVMRRRRLLPIRYEPYGSSRTTITRPIQKTLKMVAGSMYLPKEDIKSPRGEDGHFISHEKQTFGVADGVGGWRKKGIDAGEYARELMSNCLIALEHNSDHHVINPKQVLKQAYNNTTSQGSSTACIITLQGRTLRVANVGDSGFMIVRKGKVVYQSPTQQRVFNCTYQLGITKDNPNVAQELAVEVEEGDIIVAGTDGLLDNMFGGEIEEIIAKYKAQCTAPEDLAYFIAELALYNSFDRFAVTPYSLNARRAGVKHRGGKVDDITVVVAFVNGS